MQPLSQTHSLISFATIPQPADGESLTARSQRVTTFACDSVLQFHDEEKPRSQWPVHR